MAQVPFTPAGVQQKQTELYALSDTPLQEQAELIRSNLRQWVKDNFSLDADQTTYLDGIDERWMRFAACQTGFAVENRRPIVLVAETPQLASKLIKTGGTLTALFGPGVFEVEGTLTFEIFYQ